MFLSSRDVLAAPTAPAGASLTLSEIFACQKTAPNDTEWIEVYNPTSTSVDASGWKIGKNKSGTITLSGTIDSYSYKKFVFTPGLSNDGFAVTLFEPAADTADPTKALESFPVSYVQSPDTAVLEKCSSSSEVTSWIKDGENWKLSTTLTPDASNILTVVATPTPSPTLAPTPTPTLTPQPTATASPTALPTPTSIPVVQPIGIALSELFACQEKDGREWVELVNTSSTKVELVDWKLSDDDGNTQEISKLSIEPNGYVVVEITKYIRGMLTNDGDVVSLVNGAGKTVDSFTYSTCTTGQTWSKVAGAWLETSTPTKGQKNQSSQQSALPAASASATPNSVQEGDGDAPLTQQSSLVLGVQDSPSTKESSAPSAQTQKLQSEQRAKTVLSLLSIGAGILLLAGVLLYNFWGNTVREYLKKIL